MDPTADEISINSCHIGLNDVIRRPKMGKFR